MSLLLSFLETTYNSRFRQTLHGPEGRNIITVMRFILQQLKCRNGGLRGMSNDRLLTDIDGSMCT
jgi:hypothetical protein